VAESTLGYPDTLVMREALDLYMAANGFSVRDYEAPTFTLRFWPFPVKFPNTTQRKRVVPFHDLHHILTGYRTDWIGEAEIGAWELRAGCRSLIAYFLNASGVVIGLFLAPRLAGFSGDQREADSLLGCLSLRATFADDGRGVAAEGWDSEGSAGV